MGGSLQNPNPGLGSLCCHSFSFALIWFSFVFIPCAVSDLIDSARVREGIRLGQRDWEPLSPGAALWAQFVPPLGRCPGPQAHQEASPSLSWPGGCSSSRALPHRGQPWMGTRSSPGSLEASCTGEMFRPGADGPWAGAEMPTGPDPWTWQLQVFQGTVLFDSSCYLAARSWLLCHSRVCKTGCSLPPALHCPFPPFPQPLGPATLLGLQVPLGSPSQVCSHLSSSHLEARQQPPPKPPAPGSLPRPKIPPVRSWLKMQIPRSHQNCSPWDLHLTSSRQ